MIAFKSKNARTIPSQDWYDRSIAELSQRFPEEAPGFFGPDSMTWKIFREPGVLIGSYRALLLQVAHPAVGAGVKIYSNFQKDYLGRAYRTFLNMASIFFGSCSHAKKTAAHLHTMHYRIRGSYPTRSGGVQKFCANDPVLLSWILATLVDTGLQSYQKLRPALSIEEKEQFLQEVQIIAQLMGIPQGYFPESYEKFVSYFKQVLQSNQLEIGLTAKTLSKDILRGPFSFLRRNNELFATGLLPEELIKKYRLPWNLVRRQRFEKRLGLIRWLYARCPQSLRYAPPYYQALYRIAKQQNQAPSFLPRFFHWLAQHFKTPFLIYEF